VAPTNGTRIYAGGTGIAKGVKGGSSWATFNASSFVSDFTIDGADSARLYTVTFGSLYRSVDAGLHWQLLPGAFRRAAVSSEPGILYAVSASGDVLTSTDGGDSWSPTSEDINMRGRVTAVSVVPGPRVIVATTDSAVYLSADAATTWTPAGEGLP